VIDVISKGAAQSWQMENRGHTMADDSFDFGFAVEWMIKDLGFCIDEATRNGAQLPVADEVLGFYNELAAGGGGRLDTSSLIRRLT
jgi:3-hydroxyisobutyrate dehydrogenase